VWREGRSGVEHNQIYASTKVRKTLDTTLSVKKARVIFAFVCAPTSFLFAQSAPSISSGPPDVLYAQSALLQFFDQPRFAPHSSDDPLYSPFASPLSSSIPDDQQLSTQVQTAHEAAGFVFFSDYCQMMWSTT
jgi:hypothetical protein